MSQKQTQTPVVWINKTVTFDNLGRSKQSQLTSDPEGIDYTDTTYDSDGRVATVSNPYRTTSDTTYGTTHTQYDGLGRATRVTKQDGLSVVTSYSENCVTVMDEASKMRRSCSDAVGRLIEVDEPTGPTILGAPGGATVTLTMSGSIQCTWNGFAWVPQFGGIYIIVNGVSSTAGWGGTCSGSNETVSPTLSALATQLASAVSASTAGVTASFNGGFITLTAKVAGSQTNYSLSVTPTSGLVYLTPSGAALTGGTDAAMPPNPFLTYYFYDALGNLTCVEQYGGVTGTGCSSSPSNDATSPWRVRRFTYDSFSRLLTAKNPETGTVTYTYDNVGNVLTKKDARNITITYSPSGSPIDNLNRVTKKTYSNGDTAVTYSYDSGTNAIGHRTGMTDASGSSSWTFDIMGRVASEALTIGGVSKTISNLYNLDSSIQQTTYPTGSGSVIAYSYETSGTGSSGRLSLVKDTAHNITYLQTTISPKSYLAAGPLALGTYGSVNETSLFNNRLQPCWFYATTGTQLPPTTLCSGSASAANILDLKYGFGYGTNDNDNVLSMTNDKDSNRSVAYTYDALNRVASATTPNSDCSLVPGTSIPKNWGETMTIDAWGNLTARTVTKCSADGLSVGPATNQNQLPTSAGFGYDAAGDMTSNGSASYTYNAEAQLKTAGGVTYTYDGDGNRVKKSSGTEYWGMGPVLESDGSGTLQREFIFAGGKCIARRDLPNGPVHYYFTDRLGSSSVVTSSAGAIENESDFLPYGTERVYTQTLTNQNYKFTGKERDTESGLDNFGARYDSSTLGRFMTPDWAARPTTVPYAAFGDPQSLNLYGYVRNDPISMADPDGHFGYNDYSSPASSFELFTAGTQYDPNTEENQGQVADLEWFAQGQAAAAAKRSQEQAAQNQTTGRQPDGSYKAPTGPGSEIAKINDPNGPPSALIGNGQCVTATAQFSGVTGDTSQWTPGKPAAGLTDRDKGLAVATFDTKGKYFPTSSEKNSGIFNGTSTKDSFHLVDQWPKRTDSNGNVIREARPPGDRIISPNGAHPSDNSHDYYVIIVR